jgi:hypothetical protein
MNRSKDTALNEDYRIVEKLMKLVENNNFVIDAWMPLIEQIQDKKLRDFLNAFRCYAEYLITVGHDGILPRKAYELALDNVKHHHNQIIERFDRKIRQMLRSIEKR